MIDANTVLHDRYLVEHMLGQGGMGAVYLATDQKFGTTVALKQTLVTGDVLAKAFEREARLLNKLRHAALPVVMDYFCVDDDQFLVMQFIPGSDLAALLQSSGGRFPVQQVLAWAESLLDALDYLHAQDPPVVHRDIKPQNLKLTPRGEIILLDFGLAKGSHIDLTTMSATGSIFGYTPHYAPFEQIKGSGTDPRSDLYALAATLFHLMTGQIPPDAMTRAEAVMLRKEDPLPLASDVMPDVPPAVASVLTRALAMDRDNRFASAAEMRAAFREAARGIATEHPDTKTRLAGASSDEFVPISSGGTVAAGSAASTEAQNVETRAATVTIPRRSLAWAAGLVALVVLAIGGLWLSLRGSAEPAPPAPPAPPEDSELILTAPALNTIAFHTASMTPTGTLVPGAKEMTSQAFTVDLGGITMEMVRIPGGSYERGSPDAEADRFTDEGPVQTVTISEFYLGRYEVTQAQWKAVAALPKVSIDLPADPSEFKGDDLPVENVSWAQAGEFCARVSRRAHRKFRIPGESEWEYACRAGTTTPFAFGETISTDVANYDGHIGYGSGKPDTSRGKTVPVGSLKYANAWGISDMHGNVWEWCFGEYHDTWTGSPTDGSPWITGADARLRSCRGGSWRTLAADLRSANRYGLDIYEQPRAIGLRVAMRVGK